MRTWISALAIALWDGAERVRVLIETGKIVDLDEYFEEHKGEIKDEISRLEETRDALVASITSLMQHVKEAEWAFEIFGY
jgi:hypothetical protein